MRNDKLTAMKLLLANTQVTQLIDRVRELEAEREKLLSLLRNSPQDGTLPDEACHLRKDDRIRIVSGEELLSDRSDYSDAVSLHNTMRFDVRLAYIKPMLNGGSVNQYALAAKIRQAIIGAVDECAGRGLDGIAIPGGASITRVIRSKMLHRETITFDFS